jgi:hypothetical protein
MLRQAHRCWFVSPELAASSGLPAADRRLLPPIPAGQPRFSEWQAAFADRPRVYYAGFIWPAQYPLLRKISRILEHAGARLVLLTPATPALAEFLSAEIIAHVAPFASNDDALSHLGREAAAVLVSYAETVAQMPWIATSFPSKLVEYVQLGFPCAIVAPRSSAVGRWARRTGYGDFFDPSEIEGLAAWARDLRSESRWRIRGGPARSLAGGEFNPERIQSVFASELLRS